MGTKYEDEEWPWEEDEDFSGEDVFAEEWEEEADREPEAPVRRGNDAFRYLEDSDYREEDRKNRLRPQPRSVRDLEPRFRRRYGEEPEEPVQARKRYQEEGPRTQVRKSSEAEARRRRRTGNGETRRPAEERGTWEAGWDEPDIRPRSRKRGSRKEAGTAARTGRTRRREGRAAAGAGKVLTSLLRYMSALLLLASAAQIGAAFWSRKTALGRLSSLVEERNLGLALFLTAGVFLALLCLAGAFWALSRRDLGGEEREAYFDTGRGLTLFLLIGVASLAANWLTPLLPEVSGGLTGAAVQAVRTLGGCAGTLLPFCAAGTACCVARKVMRY